MGSFRDSVFFTPVWIAHAYIFWTACHLTDAVLVVLSYVSSFTLKRLSARAHEFVVDLASWMTIAHAHYLLFIWPSCKIRYYYEDGMVEDYMGKENALLFGSHVIGYDFMIGLSLLAERKIMNTVCAVTRSGVEKLPIYGQVVKNGMRPTILTRSFEKDQHIIKERCESYENDYKTTGKRYNVIIYLEGTRFTPEKHEESVKFALERGLKPLKHHLMPRTKGFVCFRKNLQETVDACYSLSCNISKPYGLIHAFKAVPYEFNIYLNRYPMKEVPSDEKGINDFVFKAYEEMDYVQDHVRNGETEFYKTYYKNPKVLIAYGSKYGLIKFLVFLQGVAYLLLFYYCGFHFRLLTFLFTALTIGVSYANAEKSSKKTCSEVSKKVE